MYYKRCTGEILKTSGLPLWFRWTHNPGGRTHCVECLALDGCWFAEGKTPKWPHHPGCHCTLDPIDYEHVAANVTVNSDYSKYDPYLFDPENYYKHGKNKAFESWGYTISDSLWLQEEIERQARAKYLSGDYILGKLNKDGQRISIRVSIKRRDNGEWVSFITGWMVYPNGEIHLTTPYGGK